jgi:deoxyribodipyrimidine photo-lyase
MTCVPDPSRAAALQRLSRFIDTSVRAYPQARNFDLGPVERQNVSMLSPYIRHRLLGEWEVVDAALTRFAAPHVEKFVQEVCWRTYWKGWLEHRPGVWQQYLADLVDLRRRMISDAAFAAQCERAIAGRTGIECFDAWAHELIEHGYLHNHARMWFASIWVFTLGLPWQLGADFFMRHLLDGDPASNTLSWRWVCGLHTLGKTYVARPVNIARYTRNRFTPAADAFPSRVRALPPDNAGVKRLRV